MQRELIEFIAKELALQPEAVTITESRNEDGALLKLFLTKDDLGRVIGKHGRTAKAIRTLLAAQNNPDSERVILQIDS
ncbi:MAG: KH domain-containing protein [Spirochaetaceae bacterium]|nr:KH domain-containing protein [Spirochaetaceae bacterium]